MSISKEVITINKCSISFLRPVGPFLGDFYWPRDQQFIVSIVPWTIRSPCMNRLED